MKSSISEEHRWAIEKGSQPGWRNRAGHALFTALLLLGCGADSEALFSAPSETAPRPSVASMPAQTPAAVPPAAVPPAAVPPAAVPPPTAPAVPPPAAGSPPPPSAPPPSAPPPAPAPLPACRAFGAFGAPEPITGLGLEVPTLGPVFSADGLTLFFSALEADENIFSAVRERGSAGFAPARQVSELDDEGSEEGTPFLSFDGLSLYFFSTRPGPLVQGGRDIWVARRASAQDPFGEPSVVPGVNGPGLEHLPRLSRDELSLLFVSGRPSPNAASNLWVAERENRDQGFAAPVEVPGINTDAREEGFSLSEDGLTLIFASDRLVQGDMDLFVSTRAQLGAAFDTPEPLVALNSAEDELDPQLSPDGRELFFASSRQGVFQLLRSIRPCQQP